MASGKRGYGHAAVVGGSIAGLLAARVLADHFDRVTIVERDSLPARPEHRRGVPQSYHAHILLMRGQRELERLFPGLQEELVTAGAPTFDWLADLRWLNFAGWKPRFHSGLVGVGCSRELLEWSIRRRLSGCPQVQITQRCEVVGLLADGAGSVVGVRTRATGGSHRETCEVRADLVLDASGRDSRATEWLRAMGYSAPEESLINSFVGYASRRVRGPDASRAAWSAVYIQTTPPAVRRGGVLWPIEGGCWMLALIGVGKDYPPTDEAGFLEFARDLPDRTIYDAAREAEPVSPIYGIRRMENRLRHYERLSTRPERFLVMGDAVCALNPVYGQGMTVAALAARALDESLRGQARRKPGSGLTGLAADFQRRLARAQSVAWLLSTAEDFRVKEVEGGKPGIPVRLLHRYVDAVMLAGAHDRVVHRTLVEVMSLLRSPASLVHPRIAAPALGAWTAGRVSRRPISVRPEGAIDD